MNLTPEQLEILNQKNAEMEAAEKLKQEQLLAAQQQEQLNAQQQAQQQSQQQAQQQAPMEIQPPVQPQQQAPEQQIQGQLYNNQQPTVPEQPSFLEGLRSKLGYKEPWSLSSALDGISVALMARDNPQAAAVMAKMINENQRNSLMQAQLAQKGNAIPSVEKVDSETGTAWLQNPDGTVVPKVFPEFANRKISATVLKKYDENNLKIDKNIDLVNRANELEQRLDSGEFSTNYDATAKRIIVTPLGSDEKSVRDAAELERVYNDRVFTIVDKLKPASDTDIEMAARSVAGGKFGKINSAVTRDSVIKIQEDLDKEIRNDLEFNQKTAKNNYSDFDTESDRETLREKRERYDTVIKERRERRNTIEQYLKEKNSSKPSTLNSPPIGSGKNNNNGGGQIIGRRPYEGN